MKYISIEPSFFLHLKNLDYKKKKIGLLTAKKILVKTGQYLIPLTI